MHLACLICRHPAPLVRTDLPAIDWLMGVGMRKLDVRKADRNAITTVASATHKGIS